MSSKQKPNTFKQSEPKQPNLKRVVRTIKRWVISKPFTYFLLLTLLSSLIIQHWLAGVLFKDLGYFPREGDARTDCEILKQVFGRTLLLTAHPDDEVMFFSPIIIPLIKAGVEIFGLSLSEGNADGLGKIRRQELIDSYDVFGVPSSQVFSMNDPNLQDGMKEIWSPEYISEIVESFMKEHDIQSAITFDSEGISSHPNHIACFQAGLILSSKKSFSSPLGPLRSPRIYSLQSGSRFTKFLGVTKAVASHLSYSTLPSHFTSTSDNPLLIPAPSSISFLSGFGDYLTSLKAMKKHWSQLVWFRYLYLATSSYMHGARLDEIRSLEQ